MARLEKPGAMKRSRAAIRFNEPRSRGSRSLRGSRAVHCAIRQILKERHRGWVRTGASVREGRTPFFSASEPYMHVRTPQFPFRMSWDKPIEETDQRLVKVGHI